MKTELELNEMILEITNKIKQRDPELVKFLNEMPITVPYEENPQITTKALQTYYDSLVVLLEKDSENQHKSVIAHIAENLPITEIKTMERDNSYQNLVVEINNCIISYSEVGVGSIPIIFLHGFPFDKSSWHVQMDALKSNHRIIALDIRGFGQSKDEESSLNIDLFSNDLKSFMDKLKIEKAVICGLSMGGYIALHAVNSYPERFEALILCDTQCIADTAEVKENRYKTIEKINTTDANEFNENFIPNVFHPDSLTTKMEIVAQLKSIVSANSKDVIIAGLTALAERNETCSTLNKIAVPTLIICGSDDKLTPPAQSEFMHKNIKNSTLKIVEGAGHVSNLEQPEIFNKYLTDFLINLK